MRVLANELGIYDWQWKLEDSRVGLLASGRCENLVDIRPEVIDAIFAGWGTWTDEEREKVKDMLVRNHFEYWGRDGNSVQFEDLSAEGHGFVSVDPAAAVECQVTPDSCGHNAAEGCNGHGDF